MPENIITTAKSRIGIGIYPVYVRLGDVSLIIRNLQQYKDTFNEDIVDKSSLKYFSTKAFKNLDNVKIYWESL